MSSPASSPLRAIALAVLLAFCALAGQPSILARAPITPASQEVRALWVLRTSLSSPSAIQQLVQSARDNGFNTLLVQVRGRGDAYFQSTLEPRAADLSKQPESFDPLASVIGAARLAGLQVHAWVNVNLVSSAVDLPGAREHVIHRHPEWLMIPRELAQDLASVDPESPAYVGKLARWTRSQSTAVEGLYSSPLVPAAVDHTTAVVRDLTKRYPIDGIHLDYIRYPSQRFDYGRAALRAFTASIRPKLTAALRRDLDSLERDDLFAYADAFAAEWRQFRVDRLTAFVRRLRDVVKEERPDAIVTVATAPDLQEARDHRLQDWGAWLQGGLVDAVCPMAYTPEAGRFADHITAARQAAGERPVWAGIGAYRLTPEQTIENIQAARKLGASGIVLFSYDSMIDPRQSASDYLGIVSRAAFGRRVASTGSR